MSHAAAHHGRIKLTYVHGNGLKYTLDGLLSGKDADLLYDVLTIQEALEAGLDLQQLQLRSPYGPPDWTVALCHSKPDGSSHFSAVVDLFQAIIEAPLSNGRCTLLQALEYTHMLLPVPLLLAAAPALAWDVDDEGNTPLHLAATAAHMSDGSCMAAKLLLRHAPSTAAASNSWGGLPLHVAVHGDAIDLVELLLAAPNGPAAARTADYAGRTPLHRAAAIGIGCVEVLLSAAPELVTVCDEAGLTPIQRAIEHNNLAATAVLLDRMLEAALPAGQEQRDLAVASVQAADIAAARDMFDMTVLHFVKSTAAVQLLLGAAPDAAAAAAAANVEGWTPLHHAAYDDNVGVLRLLLDAGGHEAASKLDNSRRTPLHQAAVVGCVAAAQLLIEAAPLSTSFLINSLQQTPLQLALEYNRLAVARILVGVGPAADALTALAAAELPAQPLFADLIITRPPLTEAEWARVPAACAGLGRALPAVLQQSTNQARRLVQRMQPADAERLRTCALALARVQRRVKVYLPASALCDVLSLFDA